MDDDRIKNVEKDVRLLETSLQEAGFPLWPGSRGGDFIADVRKFVKEQRNRTVLDQVVLTKAQWVRLFGIFLDRATSQHDDDAIFVKLRDAAL